MVLTDRSPAMAAECSVSSGAALPVAGMYVAGNRRVEQLQRVRGTAGHAQKTGAAARQLAKGSRQLSLRGQVAGDGRPKQSEGIRNGAVVDLRDHDAGRHRRRQLRRQSAKRTGEPADACREKGQRHRRIHRAENVRAQERQRRGHGTARCQIPADRGRQQAELRGDACANAARAADRGDQHSGKGERTDTGPCFATIEQRQRRVGTVVGLPLVARCTGDCGGCQTESQVHGETA